MPEEEKPSKPDWYVARDAQGEILSAFDLKKFMAANKLNAGEFDVTVVSGQAMVRIKEGVIYDTLVFEKEDPPPPPPTPADSAAFIAQTITADTEVQKQLVEAFLNLVRKDA